MVPTLAGCDEMMEATQSHGVKLGVGAGVSVNLPFVE